MSTIIELFKGGLEKAWQAFIRPPRYIYSEFELGFKKFDKYGISIERIDYDVFNQKKEKITCSLFLKEGKKPNSCVIFLHGNSGCKLSGKYLLKHVLKEKMSLLLFDFSGSGLSDGKYVTLGH